MFTEAQELYLREVLGVPLSYWSPQAHASAAAAVVNKLIVHTPKLNPIESALLKKILASAGISEFNHVEGEGAPEAFATLAFLGEGEPGRIESGTSIIWNLPSLSSMSGTGPEVTALKKTAWNLLQQFNRERLP